VKTFMKSGCPASSFISFQPWGRGCSGCCGIARPCSYIRPHKYTAKTHGHTHAHKHTNQRIHTHTKSSTYIHTLKNVVTYTHSEHALLQQFFFYPLTAAAISPALPSPSAQAMERYARYRFPAFRPRTSDSERVES